MFATCPNCNTQYDISSILGGTRNGTIVCSNCQDAFRVFKTIAKVSRKIKVDTRSREHHVEPVTHKNFFIRLFRRFKKWYATIY